MCSGSVIGRFLRATISASIIDALRGEGYEVIGPTVRAGAVVYAEIENISELPAGWTDEQQIAFI